MAIKTKSRASVAVRAKARELLAWTREQAATGLTAPELFIIVFGPHGKARVVFSSEAEMSAFQRTSERTEIQQVIASSPTSRGSEMNGHQSIVLRLPKSVYAALIAEAAAEGVSVEQLCMSKLVAQLRELV